MLSTLGRRQSRRRGIFRRIVIGHKDRRGPLPRVTREKDPLLQTDPFIDQRRPKIGRP